AAGDFNNDGLTDLFFTGNQVSNKLYLNQGNLKFEDISDKAKIAGRPQAWKTGVTLADVNADGFLDIYVCYSGKKDSLQRKNQLFINNQNLTFTEKAQAFGLADAGYGTQATFFDYDKDGDLDMFLINHNLKGYQRKEAAMMRAERDSNAGDKLFENKNGHFEDVSEKAGIKGNPLGFGLGIVISDVNTDGFPDVYVANDYVEDDYLYINQKNGTFKDELRSHIGHTSYSSMGVDAADLNNDGFADIITADMLPEDNARQKLLLMPDSWDVYQAQLQNGFWHQSTRNMLQLNEGNGNFTEIGQLAGIANTDWSWGVLMADFDNDGFKDVFISNGIARDFTNADFVKYADNRSLLTQIKEMPSTPVKNYIFRNNHDLTFENKQQAWGFDKSTIANGCVYADLDNDGDLEIISNNLNQPAALYKNLSIEKNKTNYLKIRLKGNEKNTFGIGAKLILKTKAGLQMQEFFPTRGFQSCSHGDLLFGLDKETSIEELTVQWADDKIQTLKNLKANTLLVLDWKNAKTASPQTQVSKKPFFTEITDTLFFSYKHQSANFNNFNNQLLLPMHYSFSGPKMAKADVNKDGKEDVFICGTQEKPGLLLLQTADGFRKTNFEGIGNQTDALFFDADNDQDMDLYLVKGGYTIVKPDEAQDELWLNNGKGEFMKTKLPEEASNSSCIKA
ncbi:MAG: VCBS repeat-containing protein, partial [Verrucomicrobia bacterium]|nr:VCBS repeat-containing protein [Cytophagales bacterium]